MTYYFPAKLAQLVEGCGFKSYTELSHKGRHQVVSSRYLHHHMTVDKHTIEGERKHNTIDEIKIK